MDGMKSYEEMSREELEEELRSAEFRAKQEKKVLDRTELFTSAFSAQKAEYDAAVGEVNAIKGEIFSRNQREALSQLNAESKAALEEYYTFVTDGPGTAKTVMTFFGLYDGYARKMDSDNLKENIVNALESQGISGDKMDSIFEYYKFQRDAERNAENIAETKEKYQNGTGLERFGMNVETVINAPVRGLSSATEGLVSLAYEDPYAPLNVNSPAFDMINFTDTVRNETLQNIDSDAGKFVYRTGMSVADFSTTLPFTMATGGTATALTMMGANAGSSAAKDATLRGASKEQALTMGLASATIEVATEKLPLDNLMSIPKNGGKLSWNIAKQAGIEGAEEVIAEAGNTLADSHINGINSEFNRNMQSYINSGMAPGTARTMATRDVFKNMGEAGLGGMMSGGLFGGGAQMASSVMTGNNMELNTTLETQQYNTIDDILDFVEDWRSQKGIPEDVQLTDEQIGEFVKELHGEIDKMDFSVPEGTTVIGYSGSHGVDPDTKGSLGAWKIVRDVSAMNGESATYISDLPAGMLIGKERGRLKESLQENILDYNEDYAEQIISGGFEHSDGAWRRLDNAGTCGFGDNLPSLDDYVSRKLMGETKGADCNLIVFIPQAPDAQFEFQKKVFPVTEIEQIFSNDTFTIINGIPKEQLQSIYAEGEKGKECVYDIIHKTSMEVVGDDMTLDGQTALLSTAIKDGGVLAADSNSFSFSKCYDEKGEFLGVELTRSGQETALIEAPEMTYRKEYFQSEDFQLDFNMSDTFSDTRMYLYEDENGKLCMGETDRRLILFTEEDGTLTLKNGTSQEMNKTFDRGLIR